MNEDSYCIRNMTRDEIDLAVEWAAIEGWNPGLHDAHAYFTADPKGFLMGFVAGEPIASISAIRYPNQFAFIGFYIVKPAFRGNGYGIQLWNHAMKQLEAYNVGLDGVVDQQDNYRKSGFKLAYRNIRFEGVGGAAMDPHADIVNLAELPFQNVDAYDRPFFPSIRPEFTKTWIQQPDSHALGILQDGKLAGYGVIRKCRTGYKIAPLFADTPELAEQLLLALKSKALPSDSVFLDVPEVNEVAVELANKHQMHLSFETARMYTGRFPELPMRRIFGVTSFEIG